MLRMEPTNGNGSERRSNAKGGAGAIVRLGALILEVSGAACGGDGDGAASAGGQPAATALDTVSTATAPATTTTAQVTTSTLAPPTTAVAGCDEVPLPDGAELTESATFDIDGDGLDDTVDVFFDSTANRHGLFFHYGSGGCSQLLWPVYAVHQPLVPIGLYDASGDGSDDLFVLEYAADQGIRYEPAVLLNLVEAEIATCALTSTGDSARPDSEFGATFTIGSYPPQGVHLVCQDGRLRRYDYYQDSRQDSSAFSVSIYTSEYVDGAWSQSLDTELVDVPKEEMLARPLLECGDLVLPEPRP